MQSVLWQYLIPQHIISRITGSVARCKIPFIKNMLISAFIKRYKVDMSLAKEPDYTKYPCFNEFFTRALKDGARLITQDSNAIVCPADGAISQSGLIEAGCIFQAKGCDYSLKALLGGDDASTALFENGSFSTIYLSPKDYHRVHMPLSGKLRRMTYIPGKLFSVNNASVEKIPGLFAKNERVVALFEGEAGPFAVILVGAMIVASIETVWAGLVAPHRSKVVITTEYAEKNIQLEKGDEMGRFLLGSTAILLFPSNNVNWESNIQPDSSVTMGQQLGTLE